MTNNVHFRRLWRYIGPLKETKNKPVFSADRHGTYILFGGRRSDGFRPVILDKYHGFFGNAVSYAILQPEFYAHHLDISMPYNDDPSSEVNGFVQDLSVHRVMMYKKGMELGLKPNIHLFDSGRFHVLGGYRDLDGTRPVLIRGCEGNCFDVIRKAIHFPEFYAHHLAPEIFPFCDDPSCEVNGLVERVA